MKARFLCALGAALVLSMGPLGTAPATANEIVSIPDAALKACVAEALADAKLPPDLVDANLAKLTWLSCGAARFRGIRDLDGLDHFTGLDTFALYDSTVTELAPLAAITGLDYLYLQSSALTDGTPLASLPNLHVLQLSADRMTDVSFVKQLTSLGQVSLLVSPKSDFDPLGSLNDLTWLQIAVDRTSDVAVITKLKRLMYLTLDTEATRLPTLTLPPTAVVLTLHATNLTGLGDLPDAPQLKYLEVTGGPSTRSLHGIERLTGLGSAVIRNNGSPDLSPLSGLTGLRSLDIGGNAISDLRPIASLTRLTELRLNANQVMDLSPLSRLTALTILDASSNPATDLSALSKLTSLEWLSLGSPAKDVRSLASLSALTTLYWYELGPADLSTLAGLPHLTSLYLRFGSFTTLGASVGFTHLTEADFSSGSLQSVAALKGANKLARLDLSNNWQLSDISPLSSLPGNADVSLYGDAIKDLSPLPDTVTYTAYRQRIRFAPVLVGGSADLGIRDIAGKPLCPTFSTPGARCTAGVVTYPATASSFHGTVGSGNYPGPGLGLEFGQYTYVAGDFRTTHRPSIASAPSVGRTVRSSVKAWKPVATSIDYQWRRAGKPIKDATAATYLPSAADRGLQLSVCVTGHRYLYKDTTRCSTPSARVAGGTLSRTPKPSVTGTPSTDSILTAVPGRWDEGVVPGYQWQRDHKNIKGATTSTYQVLPGDVGHGLRVRLTGTKPGYHSSTRYSATVHPKKATFTTPIPTITGNPTSGLTLTAEPGTWTPPPSHLSYRWYRDGKAIKGATNISYLLTATDIGKAVKVKVSASRSGYTTASAFSLPVRAVAA